MFDGTRMYDVHSKLLMLYLCRQLARPSMMALLTGKPMELSFLPHDWA
jgi:hypothetical protein